MKTIYLFQLLLCLVFMVKSNSMWAQYKKKTGLSPYKKLTQFILEKWTTDNGLHSNTLLDVYQTKDGYIWISGYNGLSRFDGIQFTVFNKTNVEAFYTNTTTALYQDRNGILWIGTEGGGLLSYQNSVFTAYGREENFTYRIECLFEDRERNLWLGTRGAGVCRLVHKKIRPFEEIPEMKGTIVIAIAQDATGTLWFATHNKGLFSYQNGEHKQYTSQNGLPTDNTRALLLDSRGTLWVGTSNGILIKKTTGFEFIKGLENVYTNVLYEDALQNIWIGTNNNGIIRYNTQNGFIDYLPENKGIPHKVIKDITSDNEGNIWITTYRGGLVLLKDGKFTNYSELDGLSGKIVNLIYQESRERYLVCTDAGKVDVIEKGKIYPFEFKTVLDRAMSLTKDLEDNYWISSEIGLLKISPNKKEKLFTKNDGLKDISLRQVYCDNQGNIWVGSRAGGLLKITPNEKLTYFNRSNGFPSDFIMSIRQHNDLMIIGTNDEGVVFMKDEQVIEVINTKKGLPTNLVFNVYPDGERYWIVGNGGLSLYKNGKCVNFTTKEGLFNDSPFDILEDKKGNFWFSCSKGVFTVPKKELLRFAEGDIKKITCKHYGKYDGMRQEDCTGAVPSLKDSEGKLWFPTLGGISVIDPENIPLNLEKPPVDISQFIVDQLIVDDSRVHLGEKIVLEPGKKRFVFHYTAISHSAPQRINFKFKLEGFDEDWIEAGNQRSVTYTSLPYGDYTFRVIAANNDGIWNHEGATVKFYLKPFFWETPAFYALCIFATAILIVGVYRWRVNVLKKRNEELEHIVRQRTAEIQQQKEEIETQRDNIEQQKREIEETYQIIKQKNDLITDSIRYAKTIQQALLPIESKMKQVLKDFFIIYRPKDIVSGDFFWFYHVSSELLSDLHYKDLIPKTFIAVVDCTGHGVPGAFMSMISMVLLNEIIKQKQVFDLPTALEKLDEGIRLALKQDEKANNDGLDICICRLETIDKETTHIYFTGAKRPLFYWVNGENDIRTLVGDKRSLGGVSLKHKNFTSQELTLNAGSAIYLSTDGFADQNNPERQKLTTIRMLDCIYEHRHLPMNEQKTALERLLDNHQQDSPQRDDITLIGIRL